MPTPEGRVMIPSGFPMSYGIPCAWCEELEAVTYYNGYPSCGRFGCELQMQAAEDYHDDHAS